jgi:hypothetical protein
MVLDDNTLLQTDATVIAGVLILLTIYSLKPGKSPESRRERFTNTFVAIAIVTVIIPFSVSAILILNPTYPGNAVQLMTAGFLYLIVGIVIIVLIPRLPIKEITETGKR